MDEKTIGLVIAVFMTVVLALLIYSFGTKTIGLTEDAEEEYFTPPGEEIYGSVKTVFKTLGISETDPPETAAYKLFSRFDYNFLKEEDGSVIFFNPFLLEMNGNVYDEDDILTEKIIEGVKEFSLYDKDYQIGNDGVAVTCSGPTHSSDIDYANDCWDSSLESFLTSSPACDIYVNGGFDGWAKIRVVWLLDGTKSYTTGREIVRAVITVCDD